jgi:hypothetical protein
MRDANATLLASDSSISAANIAIQAHSLKLRRTLVGCKDNVCIVVEGMNADLGVPGDPDQNSFEAFPPDPGHPGVTTVLRTGNNLPGLVVIAVGKIVESWAARDDLGTLRQLGHFPPPEPNNPGKPHESTKDR